MPVCKISEFSLQIRRFNLMNCYLVREDDGLTLIDTAMGAARIVMEASRQLDQPIRRILLTHAHIDHVGSLDVLKQMIPDAQILAGTRESQLLAEAARGVKPKDMTLLPDEPQTPVKGTFKKLKSLPDTLVKDSDSIGSLRVVDTPGHTPGHLSFFDVRDGSLYAGDALTTFQEVRLPFDPPWFFPLTKPATWHHETSLASAQRLATVDFAHVLAGHGPAAGNGIAALQNAIARAQKKLDR